MSFGKMNTFIDIVEQRIAKDPEGFAAMEDVVVASLRAYREGRHGSEKWANRAAFSEATDLFRFRCIPGVKITTAMVIRCGDTRFNITSVEDVNAVGCIWKCLQKRCRPVAHIDVKLPNEFLRKLTRLGAQTDAICTKVLEAGAEVVEAKVRDNLRAVIGRDTRRASRSTGELLESLGTSEVKQDLDGVLNVKVGFAEPRSDGESNAKIANIIEYGKHGQPPKPFLKPAKAATRTACSATMQQTFEEEVGKL